MPTTHSIVPQSLKPSHYQTIQKNNNNNFIQSYSRSDWRRKHKKKNKEGASLGQRRDGEKKSKEEELRQKQREKKEQRGKDALGWKERNRRLHIPFPLPCDQIHRCHVVIVKPRFPSSAKKSGFLFRREREEERKGIGPSFSLTARTEEREAKDGFSLLVFKSIVEWGRTWFHPFSSSLGTNPEENKRKERKNRGGGRAGPSQADESNCLLQHLLHQQETGTTLEGRAEITITCPCGCQTTDEEEFSHPYLQIKPDRLNLRCNPSSPFHESVASSMGPGQTNCVPFLDINLQLLISCPS